MSKERTFQTVFRFPEQKTKPKKPGRSYPNHMYRALDYQAALKSGEYKSQSDLARCLGLSPTYVNKTLRLLRLSPRVKEVLLSLGPTFPKPLIPEKQLRAMVDFPEDEQIALFRSLLAEKGIYPIDL